MTTDYKELEKFAKIYFCVPVIFLLLVLLLPTGFLRRRCHNSLLKAFAWGVYTGTALLVPYVFGIMRSFNDLDQHPYFSIWVVFLVFVYGSVDRVNALNLNDRSTVIVIWVKNIVQFSFAFSVVAKLASHNSHYYYQSWFAPVFGCLLYSYYKVVERVAALQYANGDDPNLALLVMNVSNSINKANANRQRQVDPNTDDDDDHHDPFVGWNYVVCPPRNSTVDKAITLDEVLTCEESSTNDQLKSTCLSFSLFWLLLHRFVGVPSYEGSHREAAWKFAKHGLLKQSSDPFTVIEVELTFLYDFTYSKYFTFFMKGLRCQLMKQLVCLGLFIWFLVSSISRLVLTGYVILTIITMEFVQFVVFLSSRWPKVMLICLYLRRESWKKQNICDCCIKAAVHILCPKRCKRFKPWQRKLGQYSLLESFSSRRNIFCKIASATMHALSGIQMILPGRKDSDGITLTNEIKDALIQSLNAHGPQLSNGIASLDVGDPVIKRNIVDACTNLNTDAQVILAWHIATSVCEIKHQADSTKDLRVATSLSKYCAYLVAFAPELLPGNAATTDYICTMTINHAHTLMNGCDSPTKRCVKLMENSEAGKILQQRDESEAIKILQQGAVLGKLLNTEITDAGKRWEVLAKFWAEMILYLAPNLNNEWEHVKRLADGGEFITHLWALLFHAGIVDRGSLGNWPMEGSTA